MTSLVAVVDGGAMRSAVGGAKRLNAIDLQRLKGVLNACGVAEVRGSPQIYAHPEAIHLISPRDLSFLVEHAEALATHKDLDYDVRALTSILWGMVQHAERHIERVMRAAKVEAPGLNEIYADAVDAATKPVPSATSSTPPSAAAKGTGTAEVPDKLNTLADVYAAVYQHLVQVFRVTALLRAFESPDARAEVRDARRVAQVDVDSVSRLARLLTRLFLCEAGESPSTPVGAGGAVLNALAAYSNVGHHLIRTTETALSSVMVLLAALTARQGSDARPILRYFHGIDAWKASALGLQVTESYGVSIYLLLFALLQRRRDFDNVEEVAARLLITRLATRPPYQWRVFRLLYFGVQEVAAGQAHTAVDRQGSCAYGQLLVFRRIQAALQRCLTTTGSGTAEEEAYVKALRRAVAAQVQHDWIDNDGGSASTSPTQPRLLSYYQLLVLAAVQGMPEADLTNEADLARRAEQTRLSSEPDVLVPSFLRLLMACCYTVPTSSGAVVPHSLLSTPSTISLYESLSKHIFQLPLCSQATTAKEVNQLYASGGLRTDTLVDLCVWNAVQNTREDAREAAEGIAARSTGASNVASEDKGVSSTRPLPPVPTAEGLTPLPALPQPPTPMTALFTLLSRDVRLLFNGNEDVLKHTPEAARVRAKNFPEGFRAVTLTTVRLIFVALSSAELFAHISSTDMLPTVAQLFALRAYYPLSPHATEAEHKATARLIALMQNTLAAVPQQMNSATVNDLLRRQLVPMSTTAGQANRLRLALFEAYLRSMATASAANAVSDELMLRHWVDVAVPAITNRFSAALANAGHDFFIAAFRAEKYVSPLFVPTYIALYIPGVELESAGGRRGSVVARASTYPPLSVAVVQHFARWVRTACRGIESCDSTALARLFEENAVVEGDVPATPSLAAVTEFLSRLSPTQRAALRKVTPTSAALLVVSALFDRLCLLWNSTPGYVRKARDLFMAYFSGLCNLLQCTNTAVIQRVCASIEAIEVEHLRGSGNVQFQFLKYVSAVVDNVQGPSKVGIAEWYLKLNKRIREQNYGKNSKL
ncbi:hypothetical protein ABB37_03859 [Leptomonas pyrrhocoris]|uniref:Uncharacterized protein n=1 Tax=Leptomonas pyrrhocoris TaxID=157538 RepID=A0A0M9G3J1_LEPPY|nr:hypothetical protein ABB37_03859 [Leptomonas pyrrhocoris]KPA81507.1 hypothetical protein ABB37_03859 [Leptomonas pyrrhocoris]|eukprot:XP_015659946.1 hypothetical protein ABB37_03859 [Leptomonas pyrrhocoris]